MKYKLKRSSPNGIACGSHIQDGRTYKRGDVVESDVPLDRMFPQKFERFVSSANEPQTPEPEDQSPKGTEDDVSDVSPGGTLGKNVTEEFPEAVGAGLLVFKRGAWFYVADPADPDEAIHEKGLRKSAVGSFIEDGEGE